MSTTDPIDALTKWTAQAATASATNPPDLGLLLEALTGSAFFKAARIADAPDAGGRPLIAFEVDTPDGVKTRFMLPVHVAITRCIELAGGRVWLAKGASNSKPFQLKMTLGALPTTTLPRVLFDAPPTAEVRERGDYHRIVPAAYRLAIGRSPRGSALEAVAKRSAALGSLLQDLFALADRWHGDELTR
jgi:hypothetical protein